MGTHIFLVHIFLEDYSPFVGIIGIPVAPVDPEVQQSHVADGIQAGRIQEVLQLDEFLFCQLSIGMIQDVLHLGPDILEIFRLGKFFPVCFDRGNFPVILAWGLGKDMLFVFSVFLPGFAGKIVCRQFFYGLGIQYPENIQQDQDLV